jgi:putative transposase
MRYGKPIRLQASSYADRDTLFHLVVRTHPEVGQLALRVREAVWQSLIAFTHSADVVLQAAVLMPDHLHAIASPGRLDIVRWIGGWKSLSTRAAWGAGHRGTLWQRRFYDRALRGEEEFQAALAYVLRNPVDGGLVAEPLDWQHSWVHPGLA